MNDWSVEEVELDGPKEGEVLVSYAATGLCHSDHHVRTGRPRRLAVPAGRRARGCRRRPGSRTRRSRPERWRPCRGHRFCRRVAAAAGVRRGHQNLCDLGAQMATATQLDGGLPAARQGTRHRGAAPGSATFAQYGTVPESLAGQDRRRPAVVTGHVSLGCGVTTGWGSAVNTAGRQTRRHRRGDRMRRRSAAARSRVRGWQVPRRLSPWTSRRASGTWCLSSAPPTS